MNAEHFDDSISNSQGPSEPNLLREAEKIGLQPIVAYVPQIGADSPEALRKRRKREKAREKRLEAKANGLQQVNIPEVPVELVEAVKQAASEVLSGTAIPSAPSATSTAGPVPVTFSSRSALLITGAAALLGFVAGIVTVTW